MLHAGPKIYGLGIRKKSKIGSSNIMISRKTGSEYAFMQQIRN